MSHYIDCKVDTTEMADEIRKVSHRVEGTTAAVVGMRTAVIASEAECTKHICKNVNRGFFALMHSQISQKIASKKSRAEALLIELNAQKRRLLEIKSTMERDYQRIALRYGRLITGINKSLKQRVQDLDRPIFNFCERDMVATTNRVDLLTGTVPVCQVENITASQQILASNIKNDSLKAITATRNFLTNLNEQKIITNKILLNSISSENGEPSLPVIVSVAIIDNSGNETTSIDLPDATSQNVRQNISNEMYDAIPSFNWKNDGLNENVVNEFHRLMANSNSSQRVKETANKLFMASSTQNL